MEVSCSMDRKIVSMLQDQAKVMEEELVKWEERVRCKRKNLYELNYFNTMQLLTLRQELSKIRDCSHTVSPKVLTLLHSISTEISPEKVSKITCEAMFPAIKGSDIEEEYCMEISECLSNEALSESDSDEAEPVQKKSASTLTEESLTEAQKSIVKSVSSSISCSRELVMMGLEEKPGENEDFYEEWCVENIDRDEDSNDRVASPIESDNDTDQRSPST